jgi:hypothetical protein
MAAVPHKVAIVVDPDFGDRLFALAGRMHVWVCDTPGNRAAAALIWGDDPNYDLESGVTTFKFAPNASRPEVAAAVLGDVDLHHGEFSHDPPWSVIEVIGCSPTESLVAAFAAFGAKLSSTGIDTCEARRPVGDEA